MAGSLAATAWVYLNSYAFLGASAYTISGWCMRGGDNAGGIEVRYDSTTVLSIGGSQDTWVKFMCNIPAGKQVYFAMSAQYPSLYSGTSYSEFYFDDLVIETGIVMAGEVGDTNRRYKWWVL